MSLSPSGGWLGSAAAVAKNLSSRKLLKGDVIRFLQKMAKVQSYNNKLSQNIIITKYIYNYRLLMNMFIYLHIVIKLII